MTRDTQGFSEYEWSSNTFLWLSSLLSSMASHTPLLSVRRIHPSCVELQRDACAIWSLFALWFICTPAEAFHSPKEGVCLYKYSLGNKPPTFKWISRKSCTLCVMFHAIIYELQKMGFSRTRLNVKCWIVAFELVDRMMLFSANK